MRTTSDLSRASLLVNSALVKASFCDGSSPASGLGCLNGAAGPVIEKLTKLLPGEHHLLFTEVDGTFPNHHPDPTEEKNLADLKRLVAEKQLDFGLAFDGDGDRIGAIDGHAPYFQYDYLERLRPHCRGAVYLVGLEPPPRDGSLLDQVCRTRDACILLAGHRMYREYPSALVQRWMERAGMRVRDMKVFPNRVGARFVNGQLDVAKRKLPLFTDRGLAEAMGRQIEQLRAAALAPGEVTWGADYVIAADVR